jgi:hypothetical protein
VHCWQVRVPDAPPRSPCAAVSPIDHGRHARAGSGSPGSLPYTVQTEQGCSGIGGSPPSPTASPLPCRGGHVRPLSKSRRCTTSAGTAGSIPGRCGADQKGVHTRMPWGPCDPSPAAMIGPAGVARARLPKWRVHSPRAQDWMPNPRCSSIAGSQPASQGGRPESTRTTRRCMFARGDRPDRDCAGEARCARGKSPLSGSGALA